MGQIQNKYHITDDGNVYKVNDDGSFTSMGNVEVLTKARCSAQNSKSHKVWKILAILFLIVSCCTSYGCWYYLMNSIDFEERFWNLSTSINENDTRMNGERIYANEYGSLIMQETESNTLEETACEDTIEEACPEEVAAYEETYEGA